MERSWQQLVGDLHSRSWSPGDTLSRPFAMTAPGTGDMLIPQRRVTRFRGTAPCPADFGARVCLLFERELITDREAMRAAVLKRAEARGLSGQAVATALPEQMLTSRGTILVDAATTLPLRSELTIEIENRSTQLGSLLMRTSSVTTYRWTR
jgi:hypothetical protein